MKQLYFFLSCLLITTISLAQTSGTIKGKLIDSIGKQSLKDASITVLDSKDSTLEVFGLAKTDGSFELKNIALGKMIVQITFQGYRPVNKTVTLTKENTIVDLGEVRMTIQSKDLQEVIVQTSPITIRKDTIEYNAGSFKTKPNAVVEDLLKKLPGVEVAKDGSIKAQGETVQRVLVDGKRFFGDDPKMATKNLPPDMVDKIQVYDAQSDQSAFSGFDDGTRTKTINITTKKDRRKGLFGKAMAGGGNNGRYESSLNFNRFNGNQQISFIGQANNVNRQAFSVQDILGTLGTAGGGRGGSTGGGGATATISGLGGGGSSSGITTTVAGGLNYKDVWSKKTEASGSYFYNNLAIDRDTKSLTERFVTGDSSFFTNQNTTARTKNQNHRINFNIETQIDSSNSLIVRPNFNYQETESNNNTISNITKGKLVNTNSTNQTTSSTGSGYNGTLDATFRHRFKTKGRTFSINVTGGANTNNSDGTNYSNITTTSGTQNTNQISNSTSDGSNISTNLSYTEPVGKNQLIEIGYNYSYKLSMSNKQTLAYDAVTQGYTKSVDSLTNKFDNSNYSNRASLGYRVQNAKFNLGATMGVQFATLTSDNKSKNINFSNNFINLYPTANFTYNFTRSKNLRINYSGRTNQPSVSQLQPVPDNSDVTNIKNGNPYLNQEFSNSLRIFYSSFDIFKLRNLFAVFNLSNTSNKIVSNVKQLTNGYQTTSYSNMNGAYSLSGYVNYGFQFGKQKIRLNFTTNVAHSRDVSIIHSTLLANANDTINYTYNSSIGQTIGTGFNIKEKLDLNFTATSTYYIAKNSNQASSASNTNYFTQNISIEPTYTFKGGWVLGTDLDYNYTGGLSTGYNASVPLWNASLSKLLFKNQAGELKIAIYDILNQNVSVSRTVTANYVTDQQSTVLKQYFSVTFAYNLRKFAGAGQQMPSMFRNMMRGTNMRNMPRF